MSPFVGSELHGLIHQVSDLEIVTESEIAYTQWSDSQRLRMPDIFT